MSAWQRTRRGVQRARMELGSSDLGGTLCVLPSVLQGPGIIRVGFGVVSSVGPFTFLVPIEDLSATPGPGFDCF